MAPIQWTIESISPTVGLIGGGTLVTIYGTPFTDVSTTITFDGVAATDVTWYAGTPYNYFTCLTPAHAIGLVDISVQGLNEGSPAVAVGGFRYASDFPVQIYGGIFQDAEGNALENGYLTFELNQDGTTSDSQVCAGIKVTVPLDSTGSVALTPVQYIWGNDVLVPANSYYKVIGYTAEGQAAWGPNNQQATGTSPFDLGTWTPNTVISWVPPTTLASVDLEVNGVAADSQTVLNLTDSATVTFTDNGSGSISATASVPTPASQTGPRPNLGNWHGWSCNYGGNASTAVCYADAVSTAGAGGTTFGQVAATATEPQAYSVITNTDVDLGCSGLYSSNTGSGFTTGILASTMQRITISATTSIRCWIGAIDASIATPLGANDLQMDTPAHAFIGFRYSTAAGDTTWHAVCTTGSVQTTVDTLVAPTTTGHVFEMRGVTGGVAFYIDSVLVATILTNVPTVVLRIINDIETLTTATRSMNVAYMYWETSV